MNRPVAPCKDCTTETGRCADPNCHASCERYLVYFERNELYKAELQKKREEDSVYYDLGKRRKRMGAVNVMKRNRKRREGYGNSKERNY